VLNPGDVDAAIGVTERPIGKQPFSADGAPVEFKVKARMLPSWEIVDGSAGPLPVSPVTSREPEQMVTLIPYGAAKLRILRFRIAALSSQAKACATLCLQVFDNRSGFHFFTPFDNPVTGTKTPERIQPQMKAGIHPAYEELNVTCACGTLLRHDPPQGRHPRGNLLRLPPVFTGRQKLVDTEGRVDRFQKKMQKSKDMK